MHPQNRLRLVFKQHLLLTRKVAFKPENTINLQPRLYYLSASYILREQRFC